MAAREPSGDTPGETTDAASVNTPQLVKHGPMIAAPTSAAPADLATAPIVSRGGKKIAPVSPAAKAAPVGESPFDTIPTDDEKATASESADSATEAAAPETTTPKPSKRASKVGATDDAKVEEPDATATTDDSTEQVDPDVSGTVESETSSAETVRQAELDKLIAARTYAAPISTRKSSRTIVGILSVIAVVLLLVLGDVWLDMGLMNISGVPHTHFFAAKSSPVISAPATTPTAKPAKQSANAILAKSSVAALVIGINQYAANNKATYPAELTVANLPSVDPMELSPPAGVAYSYKVLPAGCTTAAHNCRSYTLTATDSRTHQVIATEHS